jgi:hypothetical protein
LTRPVVVVVLLGSAVLLGPAVWLMWRARRVDFIHQVAVGPPTEAGAAELFDQVVPELVRDGYRMVANAGHTTVFERRSSLVGPNPDLDLVVPIRPYRVAGAKPGDGHVRERRRDH